MTIEELMQAKMSEAATRPDKVSKTTRAPRGPKVKAGTFVEKKRTLGNASVRVPSTHISSWYVPVPLRPYTKLDESHYYVLNQTFVIARGLYYKNRSYPCAGRSIYSCVIQACIETGIHMRDDTRFLIKFGDILERNPVHYKYVLRDAFESTF